MNFPYKINTYVLNFSISLFFTILNVSFFSIVFRYQCDFIFTLTTFILLLSIFLFLFNFFIIPNITKPFFIILFIASSIAFYMIYVFNIRIDRDMVRNILETNTREAFDLLNLELFLVFLFLGLLPSFIVLKLNLNYTSFLKEKIFVLVFSSLVICLVVYFSYKDLATFIRNDRHVSKTIIPTNFIYGVLTFLKEELSVKRVFEKIDEDSTPIYKNADDISVIVLVVGETARSANYSLHGYLKNYTNPFINKEDIVYYKNFISCGTSTAISVPCMFSHLPRKQFDVSYARFQENLLDLVSGDDKFDVLWIDNDDGCKDVCLRVKTIHSTESQKQSDSCFGSYCFDEAVLTDFKEKMSNITKRTLIILHLQGSHGPSYFKRYPSKFNRFSPTCDSSQLNTCSNEQIVNTYDNTILYTDFILSEVINELKKYQKYNTSMLYMSDHGESLGENNTYLHGLPYLIAPKEQKEIPAVFWLSPQIQQYHDIDYNCLKLEANNNSYSHDNVFHTMLGLTEIKSKLYNPKLDLLDTCRGLNIFK